MATKKTSKKTAKKAVKKTNKKTVKKTAKKTAKKAAKKSTSKPSESKSYIETSEPAVYRPSETTSDSLPLSVPEKKSSLTVYLVAGALIAISIFFIYRSIGRSKADADLTPPPVESSLSEPETSAREGSPESSESVSEAPVPDTAEQPEVPAAEENTYKVKSGDTFWGIAAKELGDGKRAKEIQEKNPGVTTLKKGTILKMPAK